MKAFVASLLAAVLVACTGGSGGGESGDASVADAGTEAASPPVVDGGADPSPPSVASYSTACTQASDCVLVNHPASCQGASCGCPTLAIAVSDQARYTSDLHAYQTECAARYPGTKCAELCIQATALCCASTCVAKNGASPTCN